MSKTTNKFSPEARERAVRLVLDNPGQHGSRWQAVLSISSKIGCAPQTLNDWVNKAEVDSGKRVGVSSEMVEKMKALERENRELRQVRSCARPARILRWRNSTAGRSNGGFHRRAPGCARGRADLQRAADRPRDRADLAERLRKGGF